MTEKRPVSIALQPTSEQGESGLLIKILDCKVFAYYLSRQGCVYFSF